MLGSRSNSKRVIRVGSKSRLKSRSNSKAKSKSKRGGSKSRSNSKATGVTGMFATKIKKESVEI